MKGYCFQCQTLVDMADLQTVRLANNQYVQQGSCPSDGSQIVKAIPDDQMLVVPPGHFCPQTVYVGPDTPPKIINDQNGQQIIDGDNVITTEAKNKNIKTLAQIEEESDESQKSNNDHDQPAVIDAVEG